jgi:hypothetical protein
MTTIGNDAPLVQFQKPEPMVRDAGRPPATTAVPRASADVMSGGEGLRLRLRSSQALGGPAPTAIGSNPFTAIAGRLNAIHDDEQFCREAGQSLLGRPIEQGAIDGWMEGLKNGVPRSEIIKLIVNSPEFFNKANRAGIPATLDGVPITIPAKASSFGRLDYDRRTVTANGGPSKIPGLMVSMAPYVNALMVENPLKWSAERFPGSDAFKQAYELGRAMEDEFSAGSTYQSVGHFTEFATSRIEQLKAIRNQMDPSMDAFNFPAVDKTIQILEAARSRALKGGNAVLAETGQKTGYYADPYGQLQLGPRIAGEEAWARPGKEWAPPSGWLAYSQTLIGQIDNG